MKKRHFFSLLATLTIIIGCWLFCGYIIQHFLHFDNTPIELWTRAQVGSSYTVLTALFNGIAMTGVVFTLLIQLLDSKKRDFERDFFRQLDVWRDFVRSLHRNVPQDGRANPLVGIAVLENIWETIRQEAEPREMEGVLKCYQNSFKNEVETVLAPYMRLLYYVFRYVNKSSLSEKAKIEYTDSVRAMLSPAEIFLLACNGLTDYGIKFNPFVEKFHLLKHMPNEPTEIRKDLILKQKYTISAFKDGDEKNPLPEEAELAGTNT